MGGMAQPDRSYDILVNIFNTPYNKIPVLQPNQRKAFADIGFSETEIREFEKVWFTSRVYVTDQNEKYFGTNDTRDSQMMVMMNMGFFEKESRKVVNVLFQCSKCTVAALQKYYGYDALQAKRIEYMYKIYIGKVQVDSNDQIMKHFKTMTQNSHKLSVSDLAVSKITNVPRFAIISNITQKPYDIWNSSNYQGEQRLYKVYETHGKSITIETKRYPQLEYGASKEIPGVLKILGKTVNGLVRVTFDSKYCRLTNRFMIVASLRDPEKHYGKYEIITGDGNRFYVYAMDMGTKETPKYQMANQRVYDYGVLASQIKPKLDKIAKEMYNQAGGFKAQFIKPTMEYKVIPRVKTVEEEASEDIMV